MLIQSLPSINNVHGATWLHQQHRMDYKGDTAAATTACIKRARYSVAQHENEQQLIYCMTTKNNDYNVYSV